MMYPKENLDDPEHPELFFSCHRCAHEDPADPKYPIQRTYIVSRQE